MKLLHSFLLIGALIISSQLAFAGFDIAGSADGEDLGRPERPDPADPKKTLPADPIDAETRNKMQIGMFEKFSKIIKKELGTPVWNDLSEAEQRNLVSQKTCEIYNEINGDNRWQALNDEQRQNVLNLPGIKEHIEKLIITELGCPAWDAIPEEQREQQLRERIAIALLGQEKWDELDDAGKAAKRASAIDDKVLVARCNVATAIKFIACIPQPDPNPLGIPSGADIAACLQKTWEKRRLCIDFISKGAFGSILPNCEGKKAGCDPDNNPINIALSTFPCKKTTSICDPELYTLITTLYHEGIHALQVYGGKHDGLTLLERLNQSAVNECAAHGAENLLIDVLCPKVQDIIAGNAVVDDKKNPYLTKVLKCFTDIADVEKRKEAARAFKKSLENNKKVNNGALTCYGDYKKIFNDDMLSNNEKDTRIRQLRWVRARLNGRLVLAGGDGGQIQQWDIDPATGDSIDHSIEAPLDIISDLIPVLDGTALLVVGSEFELGDGVVLAYFDLDGDGFIDPDSQQEILRDFELFGPVDLIQDPTNGGLLAVHLLNGNIFAFVEAPGFENFDLLPDLLLPVGNLGLQPGGDFAQRVTITEDGSAIMGLPGINVGNPPILLPGIPMPHAFFDSGTGEFLPQPPISPFDLWLIPPVFIEANGLPVIDTTSVINQFTDQLLVGGTPGGPFGIQILPPAPQLPILLDPQTFGPDGRFLVDIPVPLEPGFGVQLLIPGEVPTDPPFSIIYHVRDATPILDQPIFLPDLGFSGDFIGIPGMEYQMYFSPDLIQPFLPIGDPLFATELPLPIPPLLPPEPFDPRKGFFISQPILE